MILCRQWKGFEVREPPNGLGIRFMAALQEDYAERDTT